MPLSKETSEGEGYEDRGETAKTQGADGGKKSGGIYCSHRGFPQFRVCGRLF